MSRTEIFHPAFDFLPDAGGTGPLPCADDTDLVDKPVEMMDNITRNAQ